MKIEKLHLFIFYSFVFLLHFEYWNVFGTNSLTITKSLGYVYFIFTLRDVKRFYAFKRLRRYLWPLLLFLFLLTVMSLLNYNVLFYKSMNILNFSTFQCILLFWIVANHLQGQRKVIYYTLLFFLLGAMTEGILYYLGIGTEIIENRLSFFGDNVNSVGIRFALAIMILLSLVFENPLQWRKKRFLLLGGLGLLLPILALTGSRTALIMLGIGIVMFVLFIRMGNTWHKIGFTIAAIAGTVALLVYLLSFQLVTQRVTNSIDNDDTAGRTAIWHHVLPIFYDSPIVGVGMTGYASRVLPVFNGTLISPHNVYIEILCYTGIVGLMLYLFFMSRLLKDSWLIYKRWHYLLPAILLLMIFVMMFAGQGLYNKSLYFVYAIVVALAADKRIVKR